MMSLWGMTVNRVKVYLRYRINSRKVVSELAMFILLLSRKMKPRLAASVRTTARLLSKTV
jgi:hypothetical protein